MLVLLGEGKPVFFKGMASGRPTMLPWVDIHHGQHKVDLMGYKNNLLKDMKVEGVGDRDRLGRS